MCLKHRNEICNKELREEDNEDERQRDDCGGKSKTINNTHWKHKHNQPERILSHR